MCPEHLTYKPARMHNSVVTKPEQSEDKIWIFLHHLVTVRHYKTEVAEDKFTLRARTRSNPTQGLGCQPSSPWDFGIFWVSCLHERGFKHLAAHSEEQLLRNFFKCQNPPGSGNSHFQLALNAISALFPGQWADRKGTIPALPLGTGGLQTCNILCAEKFFLL